ncbi:MAG: hypothetical protein LBD25_09040 [Coriobacteriales bacterium]|jgi:hypothetical protein|nr:hypothetical protein [Coriobacteriales bacterium]
MNGQHVRRHASGTSGIHARERSLSLGARGGRGGHGSHGMRGARVARGTRGIQVAALTLLVLGIFALVWAVAPQLRLSALGLMAEAAATPAATSATMPAATASTSSETPSNQSPSLPEEGALAPARTQVPYVLLSNRISPVMPTLPPSLLSSPVAAGATHAGLGLPLVDLGIPLSAESVGWVPVNLALAALSCLVALVTMALNRPSKAVVRHVSSRLPWRLLSIACAAAALVLAWQTQDPAGPTLLADEATVIHVIIAVAQVLCVVLVCRRVSGHDHPRGSSGLKLSRRKRQAMARRSQWNTGRDYAVTHNPPRGLVRRALDDA